MVVDSWDNSHVIWHDNREDSNYEIWYKKLDQNGSELVADTRITFDLAISEFADTAIFNDEIYVVWQDKRIHPLADIFFKKLDNNGSNLTGDIQVSDTTNISVNSAVAVDELGNAYIVWEDSRNSSELNYTRTEIWMSMLNGTGSTLINDFQVSNANLNQTQSSAKFPSVTAGNGVVHVAWSELSQPVPAGGSFHPYALYYARLNASTGARIIPPKPLTSFKHSDIPLSQDIIVDGIGDAYIVWQQRPEYTEGHTDIFYLKLDSNANISVGPIRETNDTYESGLGEGDGPSIVMDAQENIHVAWNDRRENNGTLWTIYYTLIDKLGNAIINDTRLSNNTVADSRFPSLALDSNGPVVAWRDERDGNREIYYKRAIPFLNITDFGVVYNNGSDRLFRFGIQNIANVNLSGFHWRLNTGEVLINSTIQANLTINEKLMVFVWYTYTGVGNITVYATGLNQNVSASQKMQVII